MNQQHYEHTHPTADDTHGHPAPTTEPVAVPEWFRQYIADNPAIFQNCPYCGGAGLILGYCGGCGGSGTIGGALCPYCGGRGTAWIACPTCGGTGQV